MVTHHRTRTQPFLGFAFHCVVNGGALPAPSFTHRPLQHHSHLLRQEVLQLHRSGRKRRDAIPQLLHRHLLLVELEPELGLVVEVGLLLDVETVGVAGLELGGHGVFAVVELFEEGRLCNKALE